MPISIFLYVLALILACLAALPPLRSYFLLNAAVGCMAVGLVLDSGAIKI